MVPHVYTGQHSSCSCRTLYPRQWHAVTAPTTAAVTPCRIALCYIAAGSFDGTVIVWDVGSATAVHTFKGHQYQVTSVAILPSGDVASASVDK